MGNKTKTPPSTKTQPKQALSSGEVADVDISDGLTKLRIPLTSIALPILEKVSLADSITILWKEDSFYCLIKNRTLGKVPANYNSQLDTEIFYKGTIVELNKIPPKVVVQIIV